MMALKQFTPQLSLFENHNFFLSFVDPRRESLSAVHL